MAGFYSRYVPPGKRDQSPIVPVADQTSNIPKRKYDGRHEQPTAGQKRRKEGDGKENGRATRSQVVPHHSGEEPSKRGREIQNRSKSQETRIHSQVDAKPRKEKLRPEEELPAKYSLTKTAKKSNGNEVSSPKKPNKVGENVSDGQSSVELPRSYSAGEGPRLEIPDTDHPNTGSTSILEGHESRDQDLVSQKYAGIRSKFEKSKAKKISQSKKASKEPLDGDGRHIQDLSQDLEATRAVELHGLEPLPQPLQIDKADNIPTYSTMPPWLARPLRVSSTARTPFKDLKLSNTLVSSLHKKGLEHAFPVQSAVIPLLLDGPQSHRGDICISAATGSGKTLAYVLPMIQALKDLASTKLRGLIVVPTRELVAQAKEICELYSAGTSLKMAIALGSKPLKDEQGTLIERRRVYDPERFREEQQEPIDWTKFSLEDALMQAEEDGDQEGNYVTQVFSKIDILICTPGRLVDHLRSTAGFTLDDVQWLIIDEADRLLNESFQEWIDIVMPALQSDASHRLRNQVLRQMRLEVPKRSVRKVILSATISRDISKLNSLGLRNPKLIVVGDLSDVQVVMHNDSTANYPGPDTGTSGIFHLPPTLAESVVSVGDGSKKPLFLLELLKLQFIEPGEVTAVDSALARVADESYSSEPTEDSDSSSSSNDSLSSGSSESSFDNPHQFQTITTKTSPQNALIFTRSTESATRLSRLLCLLDPTLVDSLGTLTKSTASSSSRKTLSRLGQGQLSILIATDRASRGLDLPGLAHVISYDIPTSATTYIHRVGRTARAGNVGHAWTLVSHREARWFWNEIGKGTGEMRISRKEKVARMNVKLTKDEELRMKYENALTLLGEEVRSSGPSRRN